MTEDIDIANELTAEVLQALVEIEKEDKYKQTLETIAVYVDSIQYPQNNSEERIDNALQALQNEGFITVDKPKRSPVGEIVEITYYVNSEYDNPIQNDPKIRSYLFSNNI